MILSETGLGQIYAGETPFEFTSSITQTGDAALTVSAGSLTLTDGSVYAISETEIAFPDGSHTLVFGLDVDNVQGFKPSGPFGVAEFSPLQVVAGFGSGVQVAEGAIVGDVYVLTVLPGFPDDEA